MLQFFLPESSNTILNYTLQNTTYLFFYPCNDVTTCVPYSIRFNPGIYFIELWGASGGTTWENGIGGRGGYVSGVFCVLQTLNSFLYIAGQGKIMNTSNSKGGYNGGGDGRRGTECSINSGGGGATSIVYQNQSLIAVAAGGAGAGQCYNGPDHGGDAGGDVGLNGSAQDSQPRYGSGGTQHSGGLGGFINGKQISSNGTFGFGGTGASGLCSGGGGGGGYYGGGGGTSSGGGGGSSYFGDLVSYESYTKSNLAGNQQMPSPTGINQIGNNGNGAARITIIRWINEIFPFSACHIYSSWYNFIFLTCIFMIQAIILV